MIDSVHFYLIINCEWDNIKQNEIRRKIVGTHERESYEPLRNSETTEIVAKSVHKIEYTKINIEIDYASIYVPQFQRAFTINTPGNIDENKISFVDFCIK